MQDVDEIYGAVGCDDPFYELVERFYEGVERSPKLRKLYPDDLAPGKNHLAWFLIQRFGGPAHFNALRGAPMLRRRHMPFVIDIGARDAWMANMMAAVDQVAVFQPYRQIIERYFADAATFLVNRSEPTGGGTVLDMA